MGQGHSPHQDLQQAVRRSEARVGKLSVSGRYHRLPKRLEDEYDLASTVLGTGYNGDVVMARSKSGGLKYAVKGFKLRGVSKEDLKQLQDEAEIFLSMDHPHVARLVDVYESKDRLDLVMELLAGGELFKRVVEKKVFHEEDAAKTTSQMLKAINYIHSHGICHRDLKLENFLYESKEHDHLKLIDFGFSHVWTPNTTMAVACGTLSYVAPEVLAMKYTSQCDMWSLGVITFILLVGYRPFGGSEMEQTRCIKRGKYQMKKASWAHVSKEALDFVKQLLVVDPTERMTAEQALAHPWIAKKDDMVRSSRRVDTATASAICTFAEASQFRRACLSMMAWCLTNQERSQVRDMFMQLDTTNTGTIQLWELKKVLEDKFDIDDERSIEIFDALDTSHREEINYTEFLAAMVSTRIAMHDDLLDKTFRRFDLNSTGHITLENLQEVLGEHFSASEVGDLLKNPDLSHDGKSISYSEFIKYLKDGSAGQAYADAADRVIDQELSRTPERKNTKKKTMTPKTPDSKSDSARTPQRQSHEKSKGGKPQRSSKSEPVQSKTSDAQDDRAQGGCKCVMQ